MAYLGARFLKCDLQVQTPADAPRWAGAPLAFDEEGARTYVRACRDAGLEVIGVTDHNFASRDFIPLLRKAADSIAAEDGEPPLVIFPGFELQADVGRGCHVLALFEPACPMDEIDHTLTLCGVPGPDRFPGGFPRRSTKNLREILTTVQARPDGPRGLVICPHARSEAGIFDNERIAEWLQAHEFKNRDLLCLEVPKPVAAMSPGWQRLLGNGPDCDPEWRRDREIAAILSSDAKALSKTDSPNGREHVGNYLGFRHTWIKMSEPGIEALRLAFLDPGGRVRFGEKHPHEAISHPWVSEVRISGADFVQDVDLALSPGLNVVIGGRGTGKSSLLAALADATGARTFDGVGSLERLAGGSLGLAVRRGPHESDATWLDPAGSPMPEDMQRIRDLLSARAIGQGDLARLARDHPDFLRELVDEYVGAPLLAAEEVTRQAVSAVREIADTASKLSELRRREGQLRTQRTRVEADLAATAKLAELSQALTERRDEARPVEAALTSIAELVASAGELVDRARLASDKITEALVDSACGPVLEAARTALLTFASSLEASRSALDGSLVSIEADDGLKDLRQAVTDAEIALREGGGDVAGAGDDLAEKSRALPQLTAALEKCVADISVSEEAVKTLVEERDPVVRLGSAWDAESSLRREACHDLNSRMPTATTGEPIVELVLEASRDAHELRSVASQWARDGRRLSDGDFDNVLDWIHEQARSTGRSYFSVATTLASDLGAGSLVVGFPSLSEAAKVALHEMLVPANTLTLATVRGSDRVGATLRRQDGAVVGDLVSGKLSFGQQVTVALAILLRVGIGPLVIDQPEEDLDGAFVFEELVPLIRSTREERQLVFATHNPNIPVGGDADLIVPLEVAVGPTGQAAGCLMGGDGTGGATGGLDRPATKDAVEATLEGSRLAFRRRAEAYGY